MVTATLFLRPAEIIPPLAGLPIYEVLILATAGLSFQSVIRKLRWNSLRNSPITICVLGLLAATALSHASHAYLYGLRTSTIFVAKTLVYFVLMIAVVDTPDRLRRFALTTAVCSSAMVALCVVDYVGIVDFPFIQHVADRDGVLATGEANKVLRMRGTGIFQDPNDLALLIVGTLMLCAYLLSNSALGAVRFAWLGPIAILLSGLFYTRSRGGLLAFAGAIFALILARCGKKVAIAIGVCGVLAIPAVAGRQGEIDLESGTGHERLLLWREGIVAVMSPDLLFGIGQGLYGDLAGLVAHNSFVHAYVELGLFGGTLFFGCFFFAGWAFYRMRRDRIPIVVPELKRFFPYACAIAMGWCVGMLSLSRCYVVPTYMVIGLMAVYVEMLGKQTTPPRPLLTWSQSSVTRLTAASGMFFAAIVVFVRVMAR